MSQSNKQGSSSSPSSSTSFNDYLASEAGKIPSMEKSGMELKGETVIVGK